jgi:hypothetical protein
MNIPALSNPIQEKFVIRPKIEEFKGFGTKTGLLLHYNQSWRMIKDSSFQKVH